MNVKKYRGETTREALEKIKMDIGEDAFVLETKQVRAGGFMGLGAKTQVEISAAVAVEAGAADLKKRSTQSVFANTSFLHLADNSAAFPARNDDTENNERSDIMQALHSRASHDESFESEFTYDPKKFAAPQRTKAIETVEISPEAPKVVHQKPEAAKKEDVLAEAKPSVEAPANVNANREMDLLRAELREMKFSINALAGRQQVQAFRSNNEIDAFSEVFDMPFANAYIELTAMGVAPEIAHDLVAEIIPQYKNGSVALNEISHASMQRAIISLVKFGEDPLQTTEPAVLAVIGSTGVGKTTTVAKLAARLALEEKRRVELVTLDTYRIAAVEQLKTYAEIIGAGCHVVSSVLELDVMIRRFPVDATVLIDTTGRNPHDLADQYELSDYLKRHSEIRKCLAIQATTNPADALAAVKKFEMYGADCLALTKLDETTRPGAMLEVLVGSGLPLNYLCVGQRVPEDLKLATAETFAERIFGNVQ